MAPTSKFTPENRGALIQCFAAGCSVPDAAKAVGVNVKTLKSWLTKGRNEDKGAYAEFAAAVDEAKASAATRPKPMDEDELRLVVSEAAKTGNTQAMKLYWEMLLATKGEGTADGDQGDGDKPKDPLAEFDELAERREAKSG